MIQLSESKGILFMCVANSARSQMAEGIARHWAAGRCPVFSAGSSPSKVNPFAIEAMAEKGIDVRTHTSNGVSAVPLDQVACVITLCAEEVCPIPPAQIQQLHWPYPDPAGSGSTHADTLAGFHSVRDALWTRIKEFIDQHVESNSIS